MDSADSDHSISKHILIPQWMRPRINEGFDAEISTLSPPNQDDSFFYIPYSKLTKPATSSVAPVVVASTESSRSSVSNISEVASGSSSLVNKHTTPCLKFIEGKNMDITELTGFTKDDKKGTKPIKSFGTDDGFKSEAAQCGHSVVQVAQQMIADRFIGRPTKLNSDSDKNKLDPEMPYIKQRVRRGSKSLPASPLSTPDSTPQIQRKNRYFTGAFVESSEESPKFPGGWLVAGLLGAHREALSESQSDLASDSNNNASLQTKKPPDTLRRNNSSSTILQSWDKSQSEAGSGAKEKSESRLHESRSAASLVKVGNPGAEHVVKKPRPKPSELREMNFWSPTSM